MTGAHGLDVTLQGNPQQRQVAQQVEHLVAHKLVGEAQTLAVHHRRVVEHDGIGERPTARQTQSLELLDLLQEPEGPRRCDLSGEEGWRDPQVAHLVSADRRMCVVDPDAQLELARRDHPNPAIALSHLDGLGDHQTASHATLGSEASLLNQIDEGRRTAVHDRQLRAGDLHRAVVDTQAPEGGVEVLDGREGHLAVAEGGRPERVHDPIRA